MHHQTSKSSYFHPEFAGRNPQAIDLFCLFDFLPHVHFYAKDDQHRYVGVNQATLRDVFGLTERSDLLGRTDLDFQPPSLAAAYHAEDRMVMDGGRAIANQVWFVPHVSGRPGWYKSSKTPLRDPQGDVIGLAGVMYPIETPEQHRASFGDLSEVIRHIELHYAENISMDAMAEMAGLSKTQFNQRFRSLLRMSPTQLLLARRIQQARWLLTSTSQDLASVASQTGFFDQSHFTKRFRRVTGMTPTAYRRAFAD